MKLHVIPLQLQFHAVGMKNRPLSLGLSPNWSKPGDFGVLDTYTSSRPTSGSNAELEISEEMLCIALGIFGCKGRMIKSLFTDRLAFQGLLESKDKWDLCILCAAMSLSVTGSIGSNIVIHIHGYFEFRETAPFPKNPDRDVAVTRDRKETTSCAD